MLCSLHIRVFFLFLKKVNKLSALDTYFRLELFSYYTNFFKETMSISSETNTLQAVSPIEFSLGDLVLGSSNAAPVHLCLSLPFPRRF